MSTPNKTLPGGAMNKAAEFDRQYWHVTVDDDVTLADILKPAFWAHHAAKLSKMALIDVVRHDLTLDVQLRVVNVGVGYAVVRPLRVFEDEAAVSARMEREAIDAGNAEQTKLPEEYKITTLGKGGFTVTYVPTDAKIATGKKTRAEAVAVARDHAEKAGIAWPDATPVESPPGT